jgi:CHAD domain-containing protein
MGYAFEPGETVAEAVRRVTDEQVERAAAALDETPDGYEAAVHDSRKRAKKLRGLIRLVRPALGDAYAAANESFRDAGRRLSAARDAHAALATFDDLVAASPDATRAEGGLGPVRSGLAALAAEATRAEDRAAQAEGAVALFHAGRVHVTNATDALGSKGWGAIGPGLQKTYRDGRHRLAELTDLTGPKVRASDPAVVHEWRKRTKDAWYHVRLLRPLAPSLLDPLERQFHDLSDALGDAHDLVVICERLRDTPERFGGDEPVEATCTLAEARRADLEQRAALLGSRLYAEKPAAHAARMRAYWKAWRKTGAEKPVGGLAKLFPPTDGLDDLDLEQLRDRAGQAALPARLFPTRADLIGELRANGAAY